jgi:hypothetical protein
MVFSLAGPDRSFLLLPEKRKFDPFGESLRAKLRQPVSGHYPPAIIRCCITLRITTA